VARLGVARLAWRCVARRGGASLGIPGEPPLRALRATLEAYEPSRAEPCRAVPDLAGPSRAAPSRAEQTRTKLTLFTTASTVSHIKHLFRTVRASEGSKRSVQNTARAFTHYPPNPKSGLGGSFGIQRLDGNVPTLADQGTVVPLNAPIRAPLTLGILSHRELFERPFKAHWGATAPRQLAY
jgi:hypothetical protein